MARTDHKWQNSRVLCLSSVSFPKCNAGICSLHKLCYLHAAVIKHLKVWPEEERLTLAWWFWKDQSTLVRKAWYWDSLFCGDRFCLLLLTPQWIRKESPQARTKVDIISKALRWAASVSCAMVPKALHIPQYHQLRTKCLNSRACGNISDSNHRDLWLLIFISISLLQ